MSREQRFFDEQAPRWVDKYAPEGPLRFRLAWFERALQELVPAGGKVLDFGCGTGNLTLHLQSLGYPTVGADVSGRMLERAKSVAPHLSWIHTFPGRPLPLEREAFDAIVASSVLEYVEDLPGTLKELHRVLKPGGWLLATLPEMAHPIRRIEKWSSRILGLPLARPLLSWHPRLSRYSDYLQLSRNRISRDRWTQLFEEAGFGGIGFRPSGSEQPNTLFMMVAQTQPQRR